MAPWGKKSGDEDDSSSKKKRLPNVPKVPGAAGAIKKLKKKRKKRKKKRKKLAEAGAAGRDDAPSTPKKESRLARFNLRMFSRKRDDDSSRGKSRGRGRSPGPRGDDGDDGGGDGGFQLDNVASGKAPEGRRVQADAGDQNKKFRVKPFHSFPAPFYLNETELYQCMMAPSENVEFLTSYLNPSTKTTRRVKVPDLIRRNFGSPKDDGRIGSLKVEVLGCVSLGRAKPEVSVYCVVGDCAFSTDIIPGARSPMWPNVSKRAAVFPLHHAYARLFVGVFDVRQRKSSEADHFCGRVAIDIPPLRPDTEYDITFPLRNSSFVYDRRARGVVRLRFTLHWFSERAAIMSYLKRPRNPLAFSKQAKKQPTIPCGDPKTFRNVAVTVHGVDFPGKYTRAAFRATMREFNLYQQNIRFLFKMMIMDMILYENPFISLYCFSASMHSVWRNSVRMVPPYFVGWIIFMFVENYYTYCVSTAGNLGYKPLTVVEIFKGLVRDGKDRKFNFQPLLAQKRVRKHMGTSSSKEEERDIELMNHREFPFSERFEYHKFSAAEALAPSPTSKSKKDGGKGADVRNVRRLSIYVAPVEEKEAESENESESESDSSESEKDDGANMMEQGDDGYGDMDSDEEEEDDELEGGKGKIFEAGKASVTRRIRVGPPQNSEKSGRKVPPQVHLSRVEHMLHKATKNISVEMVHFPPAHVQMQLGTNNKAPLSDVISAKEKSTFDEFDRLLGFRVRNPNPILRITSSFLGPLMRMIRIFIYATRMAFNLTTWTDPFLSFWVLVFLSTLTFILLIFPWRTFFFLSCTLLLGPQNIAVRKYLERRKKEKELEAKEKADNEKTKAGDKANPVPGYPNGNPGDIQNRPTPISDDQSSTTKKGKSKRSWGFSSRSSKKDDATEEETAESDLYHSPRPAFYAHARPSRRNQIPRDVAVPYFRFRKDRFFDWPPDPTVSRATPLMPTAASRSHDDDVGDRSTNKSGSDDYDPFGDKGAEKGGVRQRNRRAQEPEDYGYG